MSFDTILFAGSRAAALLTLAIIIPALLLSGCGSTTSENESDGDPLNVNDTPDKKREVVRPPVSAFIADTVPGTKEPLETFRLFVEDLVDSEETTEPVAGGLTGNAVMFGLPRGMGDTGIAYDATLETIYDLYENTDIWSYMASEVIEEGTVAQVRITTPGFPSGMKADQSVPVLIEAIGNASDLTGGHLYSTILRCVKTKEALAICDYNTVLAEDMIATKSWAAEIGLTAEDPCLFDSNGNRRTQAEYLKCWKRELARLRKEAEVQWGEEAKTTFMLRDRFSLVRTTTLKEAGQDRVTIKLLDDDPDTLRSVEESILKYAARYLSTPVTILKSPTNRLKELTIIPHMRTQSMHAFYNRLQALPVEMRPTRRLYVIVDDQFARILIVGEPQYRKLSTGFSLSTQGARAQISDSSTSFETLGTGKKEDAVFKPTGRFRVICELIDGDKNLRVQWAIFKEDGSLMSDGQRVIANDIGDLLRLVYSEGCTPDDCLHLIFSAKSVRALDAKLALNPKRIKTFEN